ncbi:MAG TPA: HYR domain-containing protein [Salinivirgaceae bacterium]|nr:HYR domain-containing protein [Salinivirgaceae bacterium]
MRKIFFLVYFDVFLVSALFSQYSGGTGTQEDPYQISSFNDLISLSETATDWNKYFIQITDIDAASSSEMNGGSGFKPIGDMTQPFTGRYNGNNFIINNLFINRSSEDSIGLFGVVGNLGRIENLQVVNADVTGRTMVGILIGRNAGQITNCSTTGIVKSMATDYSRCGGLVGFNNGSVTQCYSHATVVASKSFVGGLVGNNTSQITQSYATGNVTGGISSGGLVGVSNGSISNCYASGNVSGTSRVGGLVGSSTPAANIYITNSYSRGNVTTSGGYSGGFIGFVNSDKVFINKCYSTGSINTGHPQTGGFAGSFSTPTNITSCFWDTLTSGYTTSQGGLGLSTNDLTNSQTFLNAGWDFVCETANGTTNIWGINPTDNGGYPFLMYQGYPYDFSPPQILSEHQNHSIPVNENCEAILPNYLSSFDVTDNCTAVSSIVKTQTPSAGTAFSGVQNVTLRATDASGNFSEISFLVSAIDQTPPIILSSHSDVELVVNESCLASVPDFTSFLVAADNCTPSENLLISQTPVANSLISAQESVSLHVTDQGGNISSISFLVTPVDTIKPTINCRTDTTIILNFGETFYTVQSDELQPVFVSDNCQVASIYNSYNGIDHLGGATFSAGNHTIHWYISDTSENNDSCHFNLMVQLYTGVVHDINTIKIYPNPASNHLYFEDKDSDSKMVSITNVDGKLLCEFPWDGTSYTLDVANFSSGLFIVTVKKQRSIKILRFFR